MADDAGHRKAAVRAGVALAITAGLIGVLMVLPKEVAYPWVKAFHVIAVIAWMAGMLYLPRLFVNHVGLAAGSEASELLKGMEQRLLRIIVNPAMILSWALGLWLAWEMFRFQGAWLHAKIGLVLAMSAVHGFLSLSVRRFQSDANPHSSRFWRICNEVPALLMIGIVILVIVRPF